MSSTSLSSIMEQTGDRFQVTVNNLSPQELLEVVAKLNEDMTATQSRFNDLTAHLNTLNDEGSVVYQRTLAELTQTQNKLTQLMAKNTACFAKTGALESEERKTNGKQVSSTRTKVSSQQQPTKSSISTKSYAWSSRPSANKKTSPNSSSSTSKFSYSSVPMTTSTTSTVSDTIASHSLGPTIEAETRVVATFKVKSHHNYDPQKGDPTVLTTTSTSINGAPKQTVYNNGVPFGKSADPKLQSLLARNKNVASTTNNNKNIEPTPKIVPESNKNVTTSNMYVGNGKRNSAPSNKMAVWEIENLMRDFDSEENPKKETVVEVSPRSKKETVIEVSPRSKKETVVEVNPKSKKESVVEVNPKSKKKKVPTATLR